MRVHTGANDFGLQQDGDWLLDQICGSTGDRESFRKRSARFNRAVYRPHGGKLQ